MIKALQLMLTKVFSTSLLPLKLDIYLEEKVSLHMLLNEREDGWKILRPRLVLNIRIIKLV